MQRMEMRAGRCKSCTTREPGTCPDYRSGIRCQREKSARLFRIETEHAFSIEGVASMVTMSLSRATCRQGKASRFAPLRGLVLELNLVADRTPILAATTRKMVLAGSELDHSSADRQQENPAVALPRAGGCAVQESSAVVQLEKLSPCAPRPPAPAHRPRVWP